MSKDIKNETLSLTIEFDEENKSFTFQNNGLSIKKTGFGIGCFLKILLENSFKEKEISNEKKEKKKNKLIDNFSKNFSKGLNYFNNEQEGKTK